MARKEMTIEQKLEKIARDRAGIPTLKERRSDSLDFHEVSVWGLKEMLEQAYKLGYAQAIKNSKRITRR